MTRPFPGWLGYALLLGLGAAMDILSRDFPAAMPFWMPWEFSWPAFLATLLVLGWFFLGLARVEKRPAAWRVGAFLAGVMLDYAVLQTHVDYYAQHMFFIHRAAHFVLHHLGAFLIALGFAGPTIRAGMPRFLVPLLDARAVRRTMDVMQHPAVAPVLFVGLLYFWLLPQIHTRVMLDADLYDLMNWTMALNGIAFW
ncbi:MAG: cytochrome c oxidase assembly protein [Alphaproteobacteria bacterium]|nr:cytochrome c oxidase assembly protein [Alphaproteobacteria bacterium]